MLEKAFAGIISMENNLAIDFKIKMHMLFDSAISSLELYLTCILTHSQSLQHYISEQKWISTQLYTINGLQCSFEKE